MIQKSLTAPSEESYALLDSGDGEKLERYGAYTFVRPDPSALWEKRLLGPMWKQAHFRYERKGNTGVWRMADNVPREWPMSYGGMTLLVRPTSFKHVGVFPEQSPNWEWIRERINGRRLKGEDCRVLNLFAYTGGASIAALQSGASVTHVDSSKVAHEWAKKNVTASSHDASKVRWIIDDVTAFVKREIRRGSRYDGIILDPPAFGHGLKKELWKIEHDFVPLMKLIRELLSPKPSFLLMSGYAAGYSSFAFAHNLLNFEKDYGGQVEHGELLISEQEGSRVLPCGIYSRIAFR